jgi:DNA-binding GntR family transcriptional regulator
MAKSPSLTSTERIYKDLRRAVIIGRFPPGKHLNIEQLAQRYGTSITPVRDALQILDREELVVNKPRSGFFIPHLTLKELSDLLDIREILEVAAVERAARRITNVQLEELEQVHAGYTGDDEASYERYITENRQMHYLIAKASSNDKLAEMIGNLHDQLLRYLVLVHTGDEMEKRHQRLIEALRTHNPAMARQAILNEMKETREITFEHIVQKEGVKWQLEQVTMTHLDHSK